jgi:hypothetical protein
VTPIELARLHSSVDMWDPQRNTFVYGTDEWSEYNSEFQDLFNEKQKYLTREEYGKMLHWDGQRAIERDGSMTFFDLIKDTNDRT